MSDDLICLYQPDVVVNCAAISIPRACEADPAAAMAVNVPSALIKWLSSFSVPGMLLIHLSTDQGRSITIFFSISVSKDVPDQNILVFVVSPERMICN